MKMSEQKRHNLANRWMKNMHGCLLCHKPSSDSQLCGAHVFQDNKAERLAELANGPIHRMVKEWTRVLPLCYRCHNRIGRSFNQLIKKWLERTLAFFNAPHNGKDFIMGVPQYIVEMLVKIHSQPMFGKMSQQEYETNMATLTDIAKKERLTAPTPPALKQ